MSAAQAKKCFLGMVEGKEGNKRALWTDLPSQSRAEAGGGTAKGVACWL